MHGASENGQLPEIPGKGSSAAGAARAAAVRPVAPALSAAVVSGLARMFDFLLISGLGLAIFYSYVFPGDPQLAFSYLLATLATAAITAITFQIFGLYRMAALRSMTAQFGRLAAAWSLVIGLLLAAVFLAKQSAEFSRVWLASWYFAGLVVLPAGRMLAALLVRHWTRQGRLGRRAVIVGGGEKAAALIDALRNSRETDIEICGIFDDRNDERSPPVVAGLAKLGNVGQLVDFARHTRVDLLIVTLPISAEKRVLEMLKTLWVLPVDIRLSAHAEKLRFRPRAYSYIGNVPLLDVFDKPIADWDHVAKTAFDKVLGTALLIATLPVMALVALAIRMDSRGPVLFKQNRYGFNNELIGVYKFRSMYVDACDAAATRLVTRGDPRVTRVGRFIRKTSLDELPQLFNVLKGELSLVGPRPHAVQAKAQDRLYNDVVNGYFARHRVKPGITGWAQVNGWRGETDTEEKIQRRVEHDLYYIENWSVWFDLYILVRTPVSLLSKSENAY